MARKRSKQNKRVARPEDTQPIDVYKRPLTDAEMRDELDALEYEPPVFSIPALDAVLEGTDKEAERMLVLYKL